MTHHMLHIPKDLPRRRHTRTALLIGLGVICFLLAANAALVLGLPLALPAPGQISG